MRTSWFQDDLDDSAVLKDVTFAPRDITTVHLLSKDNTHGLGYSGLNPKSALPSTHISLFEQPAITKTGRKGIRGQVDFFSELKLSLSHGMRSSLLSICSLCMLPFSKHS